MKSKCQIHWWTLRYISYYITTSLKVFLAWLKSSSGPAHPGHFCHKVRLRGDLAKGFYGAKLPKRLLFSFTHILHSVFICIFCIKSKIRNVGTFLFYFVTDIYVFCVCGRVLIALHAYPTQCLFVYSVSNENN